MPSELDRKFDEVLAAVTGPGGRLVDRPRRRRAARSSPISRRPCPELFRTFCALHAETEAVVAGDERLTFAELDRISERARPRAGRARDRARATGSASRCATARPGSSPTWRSLKAGAIATLLNGWWQAHEMEHALDLTEPKLIIADAPRAKRIAARCRRSRRSLTLADRAAGRAGAGRPCSHDRDENSVLPESRRRTTRPSCSPRARPAKPRARFRPTARSPPASMPMRPG